MGEEVRDEKEQVESDKRKDKNQKPKVN